MSAHSTRGRSWLDVRSDRNGLEVPVARDNGRPEGNALSARPDGVRDVFNVGADNKFPRRGEDTGSDTKFRVFALGES